MIHNQNTQPIQCHHALSKEKIYSVSTDTQVESPHFPIDIQIKDNYFKVQLENDLYLPVSHCEFKTKAQPLENMHQQKLQQFKINYSLPENYPIIQHRDVTLNTVSKKYINSISTDTHVESPHFPIYKQTIDNYFKVQLEIDLYLPVSHYESKTKAHPLENMYQQKLQQFKYNY